MDNEHICIVLCMVCDTPNLLKFSTEINQEPLFVFLIVKELVLFGLDDHVTREVYSHTGSSTCPTQLSGVFYCWFFFVAIKDSSLTIFLCDISDISDYTGGGLYPWQVLPSQAVFRLEASLKAALPSPIGSRMFG